MLKRTPFQRRLPPARPCKQISAEYRLRPREVAGSAANADTIVQPVPKELILQHSGYMAVVRTLPCARCRWYRKGGIQFCHADLGKGQGLKTDCRRGWPGCGPHDGQEGCHHFVGRVMTRAERRAFEAWAGAQTRAAVQQLGLWPRRLPAWPGDSQGPATQGGAA